KSARKSQRCSRERRITARNRLRIWRQCDRRLSRFGIGSCPEINVETLGFFVFLCPLVLIGATLRRKHSLQSRRRNLYFICRFQPSSRKIKTLSSISGASPGIGR